MAAVLLRHRVGTHADLPPFTLSHLLGMLHGHLKHKIRRNFKELGVTAISLQDQRQHIKAAIARLPAQVNAQLRNKQTQ